MSFSSSYVTPDLKVDSRLAMLPVLTGAVTKEGLHYLPAGRCLFQ